MLIRNLSRREALGGAAAGAVLLAAPALRARQPTGNMTIGPFYPIVRPLDQDGDLTRINGMAVAARGRVMHLTGRVLDTNGRAVSGARLELWQCNADGRYHHPADESGNPIDDGFQGFGVQETDAEGRYRFKTIKPAPYAISGADGLMRTPHIHFDIAGKRTRIVTQMHFPGEALNAKDVVLNDYRDQTPFIATASAAPPGEPTALAYNWDVVLLSG